MTMKRHRGSETGSVVARSPGGFFSRARMIGAAAGLAALLAGAFSSCSGVDNGSITGPPCDTVYVGKCGGSCLNDSNCAAGLYCSPSGKCTADCAAGGAACPNGLVCTPEGRCKDPGGGVGGGDPFGDGGLTTTSSGSTGDSCADVSVKIDKQIPTVVLLVDQSGSMTAAFPGGDRWNVLRDALMDPQTGVVKLLENDVRFGLSLYSAADANQVCPLLVNVNVALGNHDA